MLLGPFAGLRVAEACGLRVADVDFMRGIVSPAVQYPAEPLQEPSQTPVPIPQSLALELSAHVATWGAETVLVNGLGGQLGPWVVLEGAIRTARRKVPGLPARFRYHARPTALLRLAPHRSGADVKVVQTRLRHASAETTPDTYGTCSRTRTTAHEPPSKP